MASAPVRGSRTYAPGECPIESEREGLVGRHLRNFLTHMVDEVQWWSQSHREASYEVVSLVCRRQSVAQA